MSTVPKNERSIYMKKFCSICLALLLCLGICGCQSETASLPPLSDDEYETVSVYGSNGNMYCEIINKIDSNTLEMEVFGSAANKWGKTVYVITDKADDWCVGDVVSVRFSKVQVPRKKSQKARVIADSVYEPIPGAKPILYFYPDEPTQCSASLTLDGELTCTYPDYDKGWQNFTAYPDGTLVFPDGKEYYALYWEGKLNGQLDLSQGWCVSGEDTAAFLEWALAQQGLTSREANEFIIYWLPHMQNNPYNVISFLTTAYEDYAKLDITPKPDSMLRVFMTYYPSDSKVDVEPQTFEPFERKGFTVVEWGATEINKKNQVAH